MKDEKLIKWITQTLEEYGMPEFRDTLPAQDIIKMMKDAGYVHKDSIEVDEEKLIKRIEKTGVIEIDGEYTFYFTPKSLAQAIAQNIKEILK